MKKLFSIFLLAFLMIAGSEGIAQSYAALSPYYASMIEGNYFVYGKYRIDISQVLNDKDLEVILASVTNELVDITISCFSSQINGFFESVPIIIAPAITEGWKYDDYDVTTPKSITLRADNLFQNYSDWVFYRFRSTPIQNLLPAALLCQYIPQGLNNPDVVHYFKQAQSLSFYKERKPFWISDSSEESIYQFFCQSARTYLEGSNYVPFSIYDIQKNQPEFFSYLETLLGPQCGFLNQSFSYHGFNFNWSRIVFYSDVDCEKVFTECKRQVDYIERSGLPKNITDFFKTVPLTLKNDSEMNPYSTALGSYSPSSKSISLNATDAATGFLYGKKPDVTLLHELLHAFHHQVLLQSTDNPYILQFFQDAKKHNYYNWNTTPYLTGNQDEFFACTATAFLDNYTPDEPFNRNNICKYQPAYYTYLQNIFGTMHNDRGMLTSTMLSLDIDLLY